MDNVIAFTPRPCPPEPALSLPLAGIGLRAHLEEAAQTALDAADKIIAALDRIDGADDEADPPLTAMAAHAGQVVQLREAPAPVETKPASEPEPVPQEETPADPVTSKIAPEAINLPEPVHEPIRLPWRGTGNVVAFAGCAVLSLVAGMR
jgi:hypothetical protein